MRTVPCPCYGETLDRFVRPTVLAVLAEAPEGLHGYLISQRLEKVALFSGNPPDPTGLYRALKSMEEDGYLTSEWDVEGGGPARRIYRLTGSGRECLAHWAATLESYSKNLEQTLKFIKQQLVPPPKKHPR